MTTKRYKLGSQVDIIDPRKFVWNICKMSGVGMRLDESIYIGTRYPSDEIVRKARELVDLLNEEM